MHVSITSDIIALFLTRESLPSFPRSISLWGLLKKKPVDVVKQAHGIDPSSCLPNWITSIATLVNSNLFASGKFNEPKSHVQSHSCNLPALLNNHEPFVMSLYLVIVSGSSDGFVRLWKTDKDCRKMDLLFSLPVFGFVNALQFSASGDFLVVGVGQEHRLGRWWRLKEAYNQIVIIPLLRKQ